MDARSIVIAALKALVDERAIDPEAWNEARRRYARDGAGGASWLR
ncbi:hypothetical protein WQQ_41300 [Hydrocarboniphaga effusa AP103]|uniref:Uncharacterized protein n=1 Tax=Hydrocarboniphaga effusa AP103 TaxID=1172194 RepID=I8T1B5_9GAMM|nr:hypothetical protein [Hydrocarboniphaga effusa]EIT67695.1 hypothetical protein WQQ_41300 [Hydrocarboniphaga effusa AP103]